MIVLLTAILATPPPPAQPPCGSHAMAPALSADDSGAWLSWLEPAPVHDTATSDDIWRLQASHFDAASNAWSPATTITQRRDFFVNWADVPQIGLSGDGSLIATWLQKSGPGTYAYDIGVARSRDGGAHWTMLGTLNDDRTETEHGFVSLVPEGDDMRAVWLDGRAMTPEGQGDDSHGHGHGGGAMSLRTTIISDTIAPSTQLDDRTCECCPTAMVQMPSGVLIAYRDRGENERRDITLARRSGDAWVPTYDLHRDDWVIAGCPVSGPALDSQQDAVVAAWHTGGQPSGVFAAFSTDGGSTFTPPIPVAGDAAIGRVDVSWASPTTAAITWIETHDDDAVLMIRSITRGGEAAEPTVVSVVPGGRRSGYPRLCQVGTSSLVVWTANDPAQGLEACLIDQYPATSSPLSILSGWTYNTRRGQVGRDLGVWCHRRPPSSSPPVTALFEVFPVKLFVGNLPWRVRDNDLVEMFSEHGSVTAANVVLDRDTGRSRGFGFVEMSDDDARKAIEALNGQDLDGRAINVNEARAKTH